MAGAKIARELCRDQCIVDQDIDQALVQETDQTNAVVIGDENEFGGPVVIHPTNINVDAGGNLAANQVWLV